MLFSSLWAGFQFSTQTFQKCPGLVVLPMLCKAREDPREQFLCLCLTGRERSLPCNPTPGKFPVTSKGRGWGAGNMRSNPRDYNSCKSEPLKHLRARSCLNHLFCIWHLFLLQVAQQWARRAEFQINSC